MATMGLSCTVSEINSDFSRKSRNFPAAVYFAPLVKGNPWNWVPALGIKKQNGGTTGLRKKFNDIFSRLDTIHQRDRRTDRQTERRTPRDSKDRAYA